VACETLNRLRFCCRSLVLGGEAELRPRSDVVPGLLRSRFSIHGSVSSSTVLHRSALELLTFSTPGPDADAAAVGASALKRLAVVTMSFTLVHVVLARRALLAVTELPVVEGLACSVDRTSASSTGVVGSDLEPPPSAEPGVKRVSVDLGILKLLERPTDAAEATASDCRRSLGTDFRRGTFSPDQLSSTSVTAFIDLCINPLIPTLKPQSNGPLYKNVSCSTCVTGYHLCG